jgi:hypothetical protein
MKLPDIKTSLPGPRAAALINTDRDHVNKEGHPIFPLSRKKLII